MLGVSPRAVSCLPPPPISPTTTRPVWMPTRSARRRPCALRQTRIQRSHRLQEAQPGPHRPQGIVFMGLRPAKIDEEPIAKPLRNIAVEVVDHLCAGLLVGAHDLAPVFGITVAGKLALSRRGRKTGSSADGVPRQASQTRNTRSS